jgi:GNAT superfamily N-acetyltransferase
VTSTNVEIGTARPGDGERVAAVLAAADLGSRQAGFLALTLGSTSAHTVLAWDGSRPVATALALGYGESGWIGNVAVVPDHRRRGLGLRVTEVALAWLTGRGARTVHLLATDLGRPLYERLGFVAEGAPCDKYTVPDGLHPKGPTEVRPSGITRALALDHEATGEWRETMLAPFALHLVEPDLPALKGPVGYALRLPWGGGPVVATGEEGAHALWWHVYGSGGGVRWAVDPSNAGARDLARLYGLKPVGTSLRMRYGAPLPAPGPAAAWALWSLAAG